GNATAASATAAFSIAVPPVVDTAPPVLSAGLPTGTLSADTTGVDLQVTTNETATCRYGTTAAASFATMTPFATTGTTLHTTPVTGLANGQTYTYHVRCQDGAGNGTATPYVVTFTIAEPPVTDTTAPVMSVATHAAT